MVKMHMTIRRSWMSLTNSEIGSDWSALSALELENCYIYIFIVNTYKHKPISTKIGQNLYYPKILDEFIHGSYWMQAT